MANIKSLTGECGTQTPPGTTAKLYYTCSCELNGFPGVLATTDPGDSVKLDGPFDFSTAPVGEGYWREVDILIDTGGISQAVEGESGGKGLAGGMRFFVVGSDAAQLEFQENMVKADGCIVGMMKQRGHTDYTVMGSDEVPALVESADLDGGEKLGDRNGTAYALKASTALRTYDATTHGIDVAPNI